MVNGHSNSPPSPMDHPMLFRSADVLMVIPGIDSSGAEICPSPGMPSTHIHVSKLTNVLPFGGLNCGLGAGTCWMNSSNAYIDKSVGLMASNSHTLEPQNVPGPSVCSP